MESECVNIFIVEVALSLFPPEEPLSAPSSAFPLLDYFPPHPNIGPTQMNSPILPPYQPKHSVITMISICSLPASSFPCLTSWFAKLVSLLCGTKVWLTGSVSRPGTLFSAVSRFLLQPHPCVSYTPRDRTQGTPRLAPLQSQCHLFISHREHDRSNRRLPLLPSLPCH